MTDASVSSTRPAARRIGAALLAVIGLGAMVAPVTLSTARADDQAYEATLKDIQQTLGGVPSFLKEVPKIALPGAWSELKAVEFSNDSAIPMKYKALIEIAVAAQIPCHYCVWLDAQAAKAAGATDDEVKEAVAIAAIDRHWSAIFNGMQVDFDQMKSEFGAMMAKQ
jgi:AhpD family alkylhydroperoxidase